MAVTYQFEWDPHKAEANRNKHGIDLEHAATVFLDPLQLTVFDSLNSAPGEDRWVTLGESANGKLLVVVHTYREISTDEVLIRLISARAATSSEKRQYNGAN